jgi:hypothetical protein
MSKAQRELPQYRCHKTIGALKIAGVEIHGDRSATIAPADDGFAPFRTVPGWAARFQPADRYEDGADLGYFVQYADGYMSWSPSKAFEEGYSQI